MRLTLLAFALAAIPGIAAGQPASGAPSGAPGTAPPAADVRPSAPGNQGKDIVVVTEPDRSTRNKVELGCIAGGAALFAGIGLYFHLDSRTASDQVSAKIPTNTEWNKADAAAYDQAHSSATKAAVFYGIGGGLLVGAVVAWIVTAPASETTVIHAGQVTAMPTVAPVPGGAVLGGTWSF